MIRKEPHNLRHGQWPIGTHWQDQPIGRPTGHPSLEQRIEALERLVGVLSMELRELKDA